MYANFVVSLRGGCSSRRSNLIVVVEIASGKEQGRPRNDIKTSKFILLYNPSHENES